MRKIQFVAIDVDDHGYHVAIANPFSNEIRDFSCKPSAGVFAQKLEKNGFEGFESKICYEATHLGFSLCRDLQRLGYQCEVIAPSLIPDVKGHAQKTNRIDAKKMADFYMKGLLTPVHVPEFDDEMDRDLVRSRKFLVEQLTAFKNHIMGLCKRLGWKYKEETKAKCYWTEKHKAWLEKKVKEAENPRLKSNFNRLLKTIGSLEEQIKLYDEDLEDMASEARYQPSVEALKCYRGIQTATALTIVTEIGDIQRFDHPSRIGSYAGFDLREYSTGAKQLRFGISKNGNRHIRTAVIEACQYAFSKPKVSKPLARRRKEAKPKYIEIADKCMARLHRKGNKMIHRGKHRNVAKTACAREMLCFIWESLRAAKAA